MMKLIKKKPKTTSQLFKRFKECCICLTDVNENDEILECSHIFHKECIYKWLEEKDSCPMCRKRVSNIIIAKCRTHIPEDDTVNISNRNPTTMVSIRNSLAQIDSILSHYIEGNRLANDILSYDEEVVVENYIVDEDEDDNESIDYPSDSEYEDFIESCGDAYSYLLD